MDRKPLSTRATLALVAWRLPLLALGLALAAAAYPLAQGLSFDESLENMLPPGDPELASFEKFARTFGADQVVMVVYEDEHLMSPAGVERVRLLGERLLELRGVSSVVTIAHTPAGAAIESGRVDEQQHDIALVEGYLIGADRRTVAVVCSLVPNAVGEGRTSRTVDEIRRIAHEHDHDSAIAGQPVMMVDGFRHLHRDGRRLAWISTLLLVTVILLLFRSLRWVLIPLIVVQGALIYSEAVFVLSGLRLSMVSTMFRSVITVTCIAMVIHVVVRVRFARDSGNSPRDALLAAGTVLVAPIFWTCLTDAAGFGALLTSSVGPVQDYALMMAIGSVVTLLSVALLLPGLALSGDFDADPQHAWGEKRLDAGLDRLVVWVEKRGKTVGLVAVVTGAIVALGCLRLKVETDFTKNFRPESPIVRSYDMIEDRLGGAGVWDVMVPAPTPLTREYFDHIRQFQNHLRNIRVLDDRGQSRPGVTKVLSLVDMIDSQPVPGMQLLSDQRFDDTIGMVLRATLMDGGRSLLTEDPETGQRYLRVMLRSHERQPADQKLKLISEVRDLSQRWFPESETTGFFVMLARLIDGVLRDQWVAFGAATAAIALMLLLAFRSPVYAVLPLIPNALPIVMVLGLLGWFNIKMNLGTVMIAAVSMGLSVDSSIHYLSEYRRVRRDRGSLHDALHRAHHTVGRAMVFSTLALIVGFSSLCFSEFSPTVYFGAMVCLAMLGGLIGNLLLLPLMLKWVEGQDS